RIFAYAMSGTFAALGGLALTMASGLGDPHAGDIYTLNSVAAVVLGGVSLLRGVGGLIGPIAAAFVLTLVKTVLIIRGVDQNWAQGIPGALIVGVMMLGGRARVDVVRGLYVAGAGGGAEEGEVGEITPPSVPETRRIEVRRLLADNP